MSRDNALRSRHGWPLAAWAQCLVPGTARQMPARPILARPVDDARPLPDGFEHVADVDIDALRTLPVLGLPEELELDRVALSMPDRAARWIPLIDNGVFASSPLKSQANVWHIGEREIDLTRPLVMGIVNVTPDSFSDGGHYDTTAAAVAHARSLVDQGVDVLDVGGESTRPGAERVPVSVEIERVVDVVRICADELAPIPISIDTRKAQVARAALEAGATIVNDVSALRDDPDMCRLVAEHDAALVLMHMRGQPADMQSDTDYEDLFGEVFAMLERSLSLAYDEGIDLRRVLVDPGIGFGKRLEQNLDLVAGIGRFWGLGRPALLGPSRKRFLGELTGRPVTERVHATVAAVTAGVLAGAGVLRVHDASANLDAVRIASALRGRPHPGHD